MQASEQVRRWQLAAAMVTLVLSFGLGCDGDDFVSITLGSLEVQTRTSGAAVDADGYQLRIEGGGFETEQPIGVNDVFTLSLVSRTYTVTLSDIAANCAADRNPQSVAVPESVRVTVAFDVDCG